MPNQLKFPLPYTLPQVLQKYAAALGICTINDDQNIFNEIMNQYPNDYQLLNNYFNKYIEYCEYPNQSNWTMEEYIKKSGAQKDAHDKLFEAYKAKVAPNNSPQSS